jgi:hypothetical protein
MTTIVFVVQFILTRYLTEGDADMSAPLPPIRFRVVGQDDYMLTIEVAPDGGYRIDSGDYTSHAPRTGSLTPAQRKRLSGLVAALGGPCDHPAPDGVEGFAAELVVGEGPTEQHYRFWEGALGAEPNLAALVRALEVVDA